MARARSPISVAGPILDGLAAGVAPPAAAAAGPSGCGTSHLDESMLVRNIGSGTAKESALHSGLGGGGSVAPQVPQAKVLLTRGFLSSAHGTPPCAGCHGGDPAAGGGLRDGLVRHVPSYPDVRVHDEAWVVWSRARAP
jgi:hypothetical protein